MSNKPFRATEGALRFDAYYSDEFGIVNTDTNTSDLDGDKDDRLGFHKNKFTHSWIDTSTGVPAEMSKSWTEFNVKNKANPSFNISLRVKQTNAPNDIEKDKYSVNLYFAQTVFDYAKQLSNDQPWDRPIELTILYAVRTELNRHGIRAFFENQGNLLGIIVVPGIEPPKKGDPRWGIAIGDDQIETMLRNCFKKTVPYKVRVLAGFSTGYIGLNQTLLNELVQLANVKRLVFYDCLYELGGGSTAQAIQTLKSKVGADLRIVVYKTSEAANSFESDGRRLSVQVKNPILFDLRGVVENLFQQPTYISLVCFRCLEAAERSKVITIPSSLSAEYAAMKAITPARGMIISNANCFKHVHGKLASWPGIVLFEKWAVDNAAVISAFSKRLGSIRAKDTIRNLIWDNQLPGWAGTDGEEKHDLLIPEFGWEYLPY